MLLPVPTLQMQMLRLPMITIPDLDGQRLRSVFGQVLGADGSTAVNMLDAFSVSQLVVEEGITAIGPKVLPYIRLPTAKRIPSICRTA